MAEPKSWTYVLAEKDIAAAVALVDGVFYSSPIPNSLVSKFHKEVAEGQDPGELLGGAAKSVKLQAITGGSASSFGDLILEVDDREVIKAPMHREGIKIIELIRERSKRDFEIDIQRKPRIGAAFLALAIGLGLAAVFVGIYYGVTSGNITRIHVIVAGLINCLGPISMLVVAALCFIGGGIGFFYTLATPAETWTLEAD